MKGPKRPKPAAPLPAAEVERLLGVGGGHFNAGRLDEAARAYQAIEAGNPDDFRAPYSLAVIDIRRGRLTAALERLRTVVRLDPKLAPAWHNLGYVAQAREMWPEAAEAYGAALALNPAAAETGFSLAVALSVIGRVEAAVEVYRRLAADPAVRLKALTRLAILQSSAVSDAELETLRRGAGDAGLDADQRIGLLFALGEVLEARGLDADAFAAFAAGNRRKHEALTLGPNPPSAVARANAATVRLIKAVFTPEFVARNAAGGDAKAAPIFIVGMPRSGSTLIEQILASHPGVQGLGETAVLSNLLRDRYPDGARLKTDPDLLKQLANDFLTAMRTRGWKPPRRLVDKTLENYLHVGVVRLMFPGAVILHSVRDPVDTCLACYRQLFTSGNETLYDLRQVGEEYVRYRQIMDHWRAVLPTGVSDVRLEDLVADPERQIRRLVTETCGLDWDPACLSFHLTGRAVSSASLAQVRRPIYATAVQRSRRYAEHLAPLLEALGPYASA